MLHGTPPALAPATSMAGGVSPYDPRQNRAPSQMSRSLSAYDEAPSLDFGREDDKEVAKLLYGVDNTEDLIEALRIEYYSDGGGEGLDIIDEKLK